MAKVDKKKWALLSIPVVLVLGLACCCGGGGLLWLLWPAGEKVVYTSSAPAGDVRLDIIEHKGGAWNYDLVLVDLSSNKALNGNSGHVITEKKMQAWGAEWMAGTCFVKGTEGGVWLGTHSNGSQSWVTFDSR